MKTEPEKDTILMVTGVPASEIVARCDAVRSRSRRATPGRLGLVRGRRERRTGYRLVDFADLSAEDFVREAHRVLLGRPPAPPEMNRRLGELQVGRSRLEIIVRLALSPEGRVAPRPSVRGVGLPLLRSLATVIERAKSTPADAVMRRAEENFRSALARRRGGV